MDLNKNSNESQASVPLVKFGLTVRFFTIYTTSSDGAYEGSWLGTMSDLPEDLLLEILTRLPVKSLLRFRSVSKVWCSSISTANFITHHIEKSINNVKIDRQDLLGCSKNRFFLLNTMNKEINKCSFEDWKVYAGYDFGIVGSCRGVVYLHDSVANKHVLLNPSIRKFIEIPQSEFMSLSGFRPQLLGFGYDPFADDYKLVTGVSNVDPDKYGGATEVYSLKHRNWKPVTRRPRIKHVIVKDSVFLNGSCHWVAYGYINNSAPRVTKFILTFDIRQEVFGQIAAVPSPMHELNILVSSEGLLSLASFTNESANVDIWTMKEYGVAESWSKILRIEHPVWGMRNVVGLWRNEEVLFSNVGGKLVCYNTRTKSKRDCEMYGEAEYTFRGDTYFESLALLH